MRERERENIFKCKIFMFPLINSISVFLLIREIQQCSSIISIRCVPISVSNLYTWMNIWRTRSRTCVVREWHKPQEIAPSGYRLREVDQSTDDCFFRIFRIMQTRVSSFVDKRIEE